ARLRDEQRQWARAVEAMDRAIDLQQSLAKDWPQRRDYARDLAAYLMNRALYRTRSRCAREADDDWAAALKIFDDAPEPHDYPWRLLRAKAHGDWGRHLYSRLRWSDAQLALSDSIDLFRVLPENPEVRVHLGDALFARGVISRQMSQNV